MTFAFINADMQSAIEGVIASYPAWMRQVWDLGCGPSNSNALKLLRCGACGVIAVDKGYCDYESPGVVNIADTYFADLKLPEYGISIAFVAWPQNRPSALVSVLMRAQTIIYIGSNTGGNACGDDQLFDFLSGLAIREHIPHSKNTMTIYDNYVPRGMGSRGGGLTGEEYAAFHPEELYSFAEAEAAVGDDVVSTYCRCEEGRQCKWCIMRELQKQKKL